ncbi:KTSC domain-containing protein [Leuconostoc pseudomesenteroides]|uniref:KTSC domain-containing protein n=1 Tax=Leuconostoc pseudomesenteroides TaxID=33968 RepID=UPI003D7F7345
MIWTFVKSTTIRSVAYDEKNKDLYISFNHGAIYKYPFTPKSLYDGLLNAPSKGHFHGAYIKRRECERVELYK